MLITPAVPFFTATGLYTSITSLPDLISYSPSPKNILVKGGKLWPCRYGVLSGKASKCSINVPACEIINLDNGPLDSDNIFPLYPATVLYIITTNKHAVIIYGNTFLNFEVFPNITSIIKKKHI